MARSAKVKDGEGKVDPRVGRRHGGPERMVLAFDGGETFHLREIERLFAEAYVDLSVQRGTHSRLISAAMRRASRDSEAHTGDQIMAKAEVKRYIAFLRQSMAEAFIVSQGRVVQEIQSIAFANIRDYIRFIDVKTVGGQDARDMVVDLDGLDNEQMAAIAECRVDYIDAGPGRQPTRRVTIKLHDKQAALDKLCRIHGLYQDRNTILFAPEDIDNAIARLEVRFAELKSAESSRPGDDARQINEIALPPSRHSGP